MKNKPNFFIVGAPKSGTTALDAYLRDHPNIFMARKESHFFATDLKGRDVDCLNVYLDLFMGAREDDTIVGESSVWYLYSKDAINNIYKFNKEAKILAMLRNPVDMVYSKHSQLVYNCEEDEKDFKHAWYLQEERKHGNKLPKHVVNPEFLYYREIGKLGDQVERMLQIFPREQVKLILFDDFKSCPKSIYEEVLSFLGLPFDSRESFPRINASKVHRFTWLGQLLKKPPPFLLRTVKGIEHKLSIEQFFLIDILYKINTRTEPRKPLDLVFVNELLKDFDEDIDKLSQILNRDLSSWKNLSYWEKA